MGAQSTITLAVIFCFFYLPAQATTMQQIVERLDRLEAENKALRSEIRSLKSDKRNREPSIPVVSSVSPAAGAAHAKQRHTEPRVPARRLWTGFYLGGNAGYGWGNAGAQVVQTGSNSSFIDTSSPVKNPQAFAASADSQHDRTGRLGGMQAGFNYQFAPQWLFGVEADLQASRQRGASTSTVPVSGTVCVGRAANIQDCAFPSSVTGNAELSIGTSIDWFSTIRARLGWVPSSDIALYGTGGLAFGKVSVSQSSATSAINDDSGARFDGTHSSESSDLRFGFAIGGGIEGRLAALPEPNWTWKIEYLYMDLGKIPGMSSALVIGIRYPWSDWISDINGNSKTTSMRIMDNIVRVGLNYQFRE